MEKPLKKVALARKMRKALTEPEYLLWDRLKSRGDGLVFRRRHPVGWYILDFYCAKARLCVEVDGAMHGNMEAHDTRRDAWLASKRIYVYRIPAADVYDDADGAADGIILLADELMRQKKETPPPPR